MTEQNLHPCERLDSVCTPLELDAAAAMARRMRECALRQGTTYGDFFKLGPEFAARLEDQMERRFFFALSLKESEYFSKPREGWNEVIARFPDSAMDIEEAWKCFAPSRYAGAIFHSVQVVEAGLIDLGKVIGVTDPLSGWTTTTQELKTIINTKHQDRTSFQQQNFSFIEQIHATIEALKNAWRNKVSHTHGKLVLLTADFSPAVAEEILFATRAFMRRLATDAPVPGL